MTTPAQATAEGLSLSGSRHRWGLAALLLVTIVWGTTFPAMKAMSGDLAALEIIGLRFGIAAVVLSPFLRGLTVHELRWGLFMGLVSFAANALQVHGLALTSSNRNAFLTGLNVMIVPVLATLLGQRLGWPVLAGAVLTLLGMMGLFYEAAPWNAGDSLTLGSAFVYAIYVLTFEYAARFSARTGHRLRPERLAALQALGMSGAALAGLTLGGSLEPAALLAQAEDHLPALLYLGLVASAGIVWLQAWGQARVRAVEAALIYGLEPVFASLAAAWYINEVLAGRALLGAALIVAGVVLSQWPVAPRHTVAAKDA